MTSRIIAVRPLTGEILSRNVPLKDYKTSRELSGPGGISGVINPEMRDVTAIDGLPLFDEWRTALFKEEAGKIRAGGIVQTIEAQGPVFAVEAPGYVSYATEMPYEGDYVPTEFEDPTTVFKNIWKWLQDQPDGDLGLEVVAPETYMVLGDGEGPYNIAAWEFRDCGEELENIATVTPFDYLESHHWANDGTHTTIEHKLTLGFPRCGRRRDDLRFAQGENVVSSATLARDGTRFANGAIVLGNGEGRGMIVGRASVRDGRLRRVKVIPRKASKQGLANKYAQQELIARRPVWDVSELTIKDHPNARIGGINPGDDVPAEVDVEHVGRVKLWLRVLSVEEQSANPGRAVLKTMRSDFFTYAMEESPDGRTQLVSV